MEKMAGYAFVAGFLCTGMAMVTYFLYALSGLRAARMQAAGFPMTTTTTRFVAGPRTATIGTYGTIFGVLAVAAITASLIFRTIATGHGPFANQYEFTVAFVWGTLVSYYWFERRYHQRILALVAIPIAFLLQGATFVFPVVFPTQVEPLVPALQNNLLLTVHVAVAIVAYGSFTVACAAAVLYLVQPETGRWGLPRPEILDEIGYKAIVVGFPFLTLTIVLGALWADVAWGKYWSWDPKETASLATWLIYAVYLHARVVRGWRGKRAAWLPIVGFAATLLTFFGVNIFFSSLHSYAGLN